MRQPSRQQRLAFLHFAAISAHGFAIGKVLRRILHDVAVQNLLRRWAKLLI
jgi:hypothetical protein